MENSITELLHLQDYLVLGMTHHKDSDELRVEPKLKDACPHCGTMSDSVHQHGEKPSRILWSFIGQRPVFIVVIRRRLWCKQCQKAFTQTLPGVDKQQRMSVLAKIQLLQNLAEQSFAATKRSLGVSYGRSRRVLLKLTMPWYDWHDLVGEQGAIHLGIDEHSFRGNDLVITLTCLSTHKLLGILPDDRQKTLKRALHDIPEEIRQRITAVCIDGKESYLKVVKKELPEAVVVFDHFHLIQDANRRLNDTRKLEQSETKAKLRRWPLIKNAERLSERQVTQRDEMLLRYPTIAAQYWVKENLRELYRCVDWEQAHEKLTLILSNCESAEDAETVRWGRSLRRWSPEILNYFKVRITNGFTEGCHTKVKLLKRLSYGFRNVQVYLRKMLLGFLPIPPLPHILT